MQPTPSPLEAWFNLYQSGARWDLGGTMVPFPSGPEAEGWLAGFWTSPPDFTYGASSGSPALRERVASMYGVSRSSVLLTSGATEANFLALATLLAPGDRILLQDPLYGQFEALATSMGARCARWPVPLDPWQNPDFEALEAQVTPDTRLVVLNTPHNPTGRTIGPQSLAGLFRRLDDTLGGHLLVDEVYRQADPAPAPSAWGSSDRVLVTDGCSKRWGMPGLRLGWLVAPPEVIERATQLRESTSHSNSRLSEQLAEHLWPFDGKIVQAQGAIAQRNRNLLTSWLARLGRPEAVPPSGVMMWLATPGQDDRLLALHLREKGLFAVPGCVLGCPGGLRIGFGHRDADLLEEALTVLAMALEDVAGMVLL